MDEVLILHYTLVKLALNQVDSGQRKPSKGSKNSAGRVVAFVFRDAHDAIFINYYEKGERVSSDYYIAILVRLSDGIAKKRPE